MSETKLERLERVKADVNAPAEIFSRLTDGEAPQTLPQIAKAWDVPRGAFVDWFCTKHRDKYDAALKVLTDGMVFESLGIADDVSEDRDAIAKAKLRIETKLKTAARWDRERYGENQGPSVVVNVSLADTEKEILALEERLGLAKPALLPAKVADVVDAEPI